MDLADVTVTSLLSIDVGERTRCSLNHHPPTIDIPSAKTVYDYNSIAYLRTKIYPTSSKMSSKRPRSHVSKEQGVEGAVYSVRVKTGNRKGAGTDAKVFLTITGKSNEKGWDTYLYTLQRVKIVSINWNFSRPAHIPVIWA